jgi:DNA topoisomerase IB
VSLPQPPVSELFQYLDDEGRRHSVDSGDANEYLRTIAGHEITAKGFRTWAATNLAFLALLELGEGRPTKKGNFPAHQPGRIFPFLRLPPLLTSLLAYFVV